PPKRVSGKSCLATQPGTPPATPIHPPHGRFVAARTAWLPLAPRICSPDRVSRGPSHPARAARGRCLQFAPSTRWPIAAPSQPTERGTIMNNTKRVRIAGAAAAAVTTLTLIASLHGYAAGIQRLAAREVVQMEPVVVIGTQVARQAAVANPHVGEI